MKTSSQRDLVIRLLQDNGYQHLVGGIKVGSVLFEFPAVLVGIRNASDLVIVVESIDRSGEPHLRRTVLALARSLDMAQSRRSISLVVIGLRLTGIILREVSAVCRVLHVDTSSDCSLSERNRDALAVLLPLKLPSEGVTRGSPLDLVREQVGAINEKTVLSFLRAAEQGTAHVRAALREHLSVALSEDS